jgi:hypothetical protein
MYLPSFAMLLSLAAGSYCLYMTNRLGKELTALEAQMAELEARLDALEKL